MGSLRHAGRAAGARLLLATTTLLSLACSGERVLGDYPPSTCDLEKPPKEFNFAPLTIATFWAEDTRESAAFDTLFKRIDPRYAKGQDARESRVDAQLKLTNAFKSQRLPDVFQVNGGNDVLRWVEGRDAESTDVCALDRMRDAYDWQTRYFETALAPLTCRGNLYGLPVGIHHLNVLFYNRELFGELQQLAREQGEELVEPSALADASALVAELQKVAALSPRTADGEAIVPLAIGGESEWPLTIVAFENVLLSLGADVYETLWQGGLIDDDGTRGARLRGALVRMVSLLRALAEVSNLEQRIGWQDALLEVEAGRALMSVTGDWGWAQLNDPASPNVATVDFPGTDGVFVYTPDSFAVPREVRKNGFPAHYFLHEIVEVKDAVIEFSALKHSIPARNDLYDDDLKRLPTETLRDTYRRFSECDAGSDCKLLLAVSGLGPPPGTDPCVDEIDALLTLAVTGVSPSQEMMEERRCPVPFPKPAEAADRLVNLLISIGGRRFADDCQ